MSSQAIRTEQLPAVKVPLISGALDGQILLIYGVLTLIGLIMVTSASIGVADAQMNDPFYYGKRQFLRLLDKIQVGLETLQAPGKDVVPA